MGVGLLCSERLDGSIAVSFRVPLSFMVNSDLYSLILPIQPNSLINPHLCCEPFDSSIAARTAFASPLAALKQKQPNHHDAV